MGKNKHLREIIEGNEKQIALHEKKVADELTKVQPNLKRVAKWEKDIRIFRNEVTKYSKKLPGGKK